MLVYTKISDGIHSFMVEILLKKTLLIEGLRHRLNRDTNSILLARRCFYSVQIPEFSFNYR